MKLRRDIASSPLRTGAETWVAISGLIAGAGSTDAGQLHAAGTIMAALIAEEIHTDEPMTLVGSKHRLVIYCLCGPDALIMGSDVDPIDWNPTEGDWTLHVPCREEDLVWAGAALASRASRIKLHKRGEAPVMDDTAGTSAKPLSIDWGELG